MTSNIDKQSLPHDKLLLYDNMIGMNSEIDRKGATLPYTSVNGNMFTFFSKDGTINIRLPEKERVDFMNTFEARLSVQHGVTLKEYVVVPESLLENTILLLHYLNISFEYAKTLKPKPSN